MQGIVVMQRLEERSVLEEFTVKYRSQKIRQAQISTKVGKSVVLKEQN